MYQDISTVLFWDPFTLTAVVFITSFLLLGFSTICRAHKTNILAPKFKDWRHFVNSAAAPEFVEVYFFDFKDKFYIFLLNKGQILR